MSMRAYCRDQVPIERMLMQQPEVRTSTPYNVHNSCTIIAKLDDFLYLNKPNDACLLVVSRNQSPNHVQPKVSNIGYPALAIFVVLQITTKGQHIRLPIVTTLLCHHHQASLFLQHTVCQFFHMHNVFLKMIRNCCCKRPNSLLKEPISAYSTAVGMSAKRCQVCSASRAARVDWGPACQMGPTRARHSAIHPWPL